MRAWEEFIDKQEKALGTEAVQKWLRALKIVHFDSGNLYLEAKDSFHVLWFEEHIRPLIKSGLFNNNFRKVKVHLSVADGALASKVKKENAKPTPSVPLVFDKLDAAMTLENWVMGASNSVLFRFIHEQLEGPTAFTPNSAENLTFDKVSAQGLQQAKPVLLRMLTKEQSSAHLQEKQAYPNKLGDADSCKDGDASAVKSQVFSRVWYNPIYLWGEPGCGKTHLLMALVHAYQKRGLHALYARAETFTEHMISAIRSSEMQSFRKAYRHVDVLLIDDVHLFARKGATQEEFFHTFNTLHTSGRQIILSSNCAPGMLEEIEPRLVSRFEWGINIHFEPLKADELKQMLFQRCTLFHFPLSEEVITFLVQVFPKPKSVHRALEALILRCHLYRDARRKRNPHSLEKNEVEEMLKDLILQEQHAALSPERIIATVSTIFGIRTEDLLGKSQSQECSYPRQIAMYLCRQELKLSFQGIGQAFGRDHSTVMTSVKQIENRIESSDKELLSSLSEFKNLITK